MISFAGRPIIGFADADCPDNPPPPAGYAVWRGPVPPDLTRWAVSLLRNISAPPYGKQWSAQSSGAVVVARKDRHTWTFRKNEDGTTTLVTGICIPGITLYRPIPVGVTGLGDAPVLDPATAKPDPQLALYSSLHPPERTDWGLVAAGAAAITTTVGLFLWGMHAAGRR